MIVSAIVAVGRNNVIGKDNEIPWYLPADLKYFKRRTLNHHIIMGRKSFESIGRPLPGRTNIVISRDPTRPVAGARLVFSLAQALQQAREVAAADGVDEVMVIGGAEVYAQVLPLADRLYLTEVHADVAGDTFLPAIAWNEWREVARKRHAAAGGNPHDYSFVVYERLARH